MVKQKNTIKKLFIFTMTILFFMMGLYDFVYLLSIGLVYYGKHYLHITEIIYPTKIFTVMFLFSIPMYVFIHTVLKNS